MRWLILGVLLGFAAVGAVVAGIPRRGMRLRHGLLFVALAAFVSLLYVSPRVEGAPLQGDTTVTISLASGNDDAHYRAGIFNQTTTNTPTGDHTTATSIGTFGMRFPLTALVGIDPSRITSAHLDMTCASAGSPNFSGVVRVETAPAAAWADTSTDRPSARYSAVGSAAEVGWSVTGWATDSTHSSPDIHSAIVGALGTGSWNYSTDYLGVIVGGNAVSIAQCNLYTRNFSTVTAYRPTLVVTYGPEVTTTTAAPTTTTEAPTTTTEAPTTTAAPTTTTEAPSSTTTTTAAPPSSTTTTIPPDPEGPATPYEATMVTGMLALVVASWATWARLGRVGLGR